ncbi:MAG: hypothetical protein RH942_11545 [Kiloniellaceae bacterium]
MARFGHFCLSIAMLIVAAACAGHSAPRVTFSGPDYITIKHDPVFTGPPPFEVLAMAERYCAADKKRAEVTPYGRYVNSTAFVCVAEGEEVK